MFVIKAYDPLMREKQYLVNEIQWVVGNNKRFRPFSHPDIKKFNSANDAVCFLLESNMFWNWGEIAILDDRGNNYRVPELSLKTNSFKLTDKLKEREILETRVCDGREFTPN